MKPSAAETETKTASRKTRGSKAEKPDEWQNRLVEEVRFTAVFPQLPVSISISPPCVSSPISLSPPVFLGLCLPNETSALLEGWPQALSSFCASSQSKFQVLTSNPKPMNLNP